MAEYSASHRMVQSCAGNEHIIGFTVKARLNLPPTTFQFS